MIELLLPNKLTVPELHADHIVRPRLLQKLDAGRDRRLTVLSAPAGFGKTTLLAGWARQHAADPIAFAWLTLDEQDNDLARFLRYLGAAFEPQAPAALPRLAPPQPPDVETILTRLINDLARRSHKLVLILDDYHVIGHQAIHNGVAFLIEHAPPHLHLVVAGRSDPPLALARRRVRGELNELRTADLCFTAQEARQFLTAGVGHPLAESTLEPLTRCTEGWPAGLQLAAASLRGLDHAAAARFVADFGGTHRHVYAYLVEEVLQRQPPAVQHFLLHTVILDRLTAALCQHVTAAGGADAGGADAGGADAGGADAGGADAGDTAAAAQTILDTLAANNLFLLPLDAHGRWFRYHTLFAETLRAHLQESAPDLLPHLHLRACRWYAGHGDGAQAIRHALAARDYDTAADLIETLAEQMWPFGHHQLIRSWLDALPEAVVTQRVGLCLLHAWVLFLLDRGPEASRHLHLAATELARRAEQTPRHALLQGRHAAIHGAMCAHRHETIAAIAHMQAALEQLPPDDVHWRQVAMIGLGLAQLAEGHARDAIHTLHAAALACEECGDTYLAFAAWWHQIEACRAQGQLRRSEQCSARLAQLAALDYGDSLALAAVADLARGILAYDRNQLAHARQLLTAALPLAWPGGQPRIALQAHLTLARVAQALADDAGKQHHLDAATQLVRAFNLTAERLSVSATAAHLLLADGRLYDTHWQLENDGIGPTSPPTYHNEAALLVLVRLLLAEQRSDGALKIVAALLPPAELAGRDGSIIEICIVKALALAQKQQIERALACLQRALALAAAEDNARLFVAEGRPLARLLSQLPARSPFVDHLLAQIDVPQPLAGLAEPLTVRETEILRMIAAGAGNQAIADRLYISLGTVKGHVNHILGKLAAQNRTEAVARARALRLL